MKTQIVYIAVSNDNDLFLEELWISLYSLRIFHPEAAVKVLVDDSTNERLTNHPLKRLITDVIVVETPKDVTPARKSRIIKTSVRNIIDGAYLFIDTDTVVCHSLDEIDNLGCDIAAVPDTHSSISESAMVQVWTDKVKEVYGVDITNDEYYFNSGVMYVNDNERTRKFYEDWNMYWLKYASDGKRNADQPGLAVTNHFHKGIITKLPDKYNCQLGLSMKYFHEAYIVHSIHMNFIEDQSFSPFLGGTIYKELKSKGEITPKMAETIINCKSAWNVRCQIVGPDQIDFLWSPAGQAFSRAMKRSGTWKKILNRCGGYLIRYERGKQKIQRLLKL